MRTYQNPFTEQLIVPIDPTDSDAGSGVNATQVAIHFPTKINRGVFVNLPREPEFTYSY